MQTPHTIFFDTVGLSPIQLPGAIPASQQIHYWDERVQAFLFEAFGSLIPKLEILADGQAAYHHRHPESDSFIAAKPADSIDDIPQGEAMKLLQGWLALRKLVMEETISENVRTLLMNLRIPDPNLSPWFYCVQSLPDGQTKLYVIIGFEGSDLQTVSLEEGLSAMLNVPQSQLESLLSTSMAPTGDTKRVYNRDSAAIEKANGNVTPKISPKKSITRNPVMLALAASTTVVAISIFILMSGGAKGTNQNNEKNSNQDSSVTTQPNDLVNAEQVAITTDRTIVSGLETLAQPEGIDPNPPKEMKLDMVSHTEENLQDATDDLKLEMTTDLKSEANGNNTEKSYSADDMIKQMSQ